MIDARLLREDLAFITKALEKKCYTLDRITYAELESTRKKLQSHTESLQSQRNNLAREIGKANH